MEKQYHSDPKNGKGIPREVERYQTIYANKSINPPSE
jgi:hypothetical protein